MTKRYINITLPNKPITISGFENTNIEDIDLIVNSSVDVTYCTILNKIPEQSINQCIINMCTKIRPAGTLLLSFIDVKNICKNFVNDRMPNQEFMGLIHGLYNVYFLQDFEKLYREYLFNEFVVTNTELNNNILNISMQRKSNG